jgi:hypothetical protein
MLALRPPISSAMKISTARPILSVAGLLLTFGSVSGAAAPAAAEPPPTSKSGWAERVAAVPKKLAFWDKTQKPAAAEPAAEKAVPPAAKKSPAGRAAKPVPAGQPTAGPAPRAATSQSTAAKPKKGAPPAAATAGGAPAAEEPEKKSFLAKFPPLPSLPFLDRRAGQEKGGREGAPPATEAGPSKSRGAEAKPPSANRPEVAGHRATTPAPGDAEPAKLEKPSLWSRVAAAVKPGGAVAAKPPTAPIARGLVPPGVTAPDSSTFVITKDDSAFYTFGPQQATPPDEYLATGTVVTLTSKSWGWATVTLADGRTGMVDRTALRQALITDLIPANGMGGPASLMAALSPGHLKRASSPNFVLPAAEMPDLPTGSDAGGAGAPGNPLLLPFSPDDTTGSADGFPLPAIQPLPEPEGPASEPAPAPDPAAAAPESAPEPAESEGPEPDQSEATPEAPVPGVIAPEAPGTGDADPAPVSE